MVREGKHKNKTVKKRNILLLMEAKILRKVKLH